jgi:hypothetical protein
MGIVERLGGVEPKEYKGEELPSIEKRLHAVNLMSTFYAFQALAIASCLRVLTKGYLYVI